MDLTKTKNLLVFSLTAETLFASYGLTIGKETALISLLYLLAGLLFIFCVLKMPAARIPLKKELKNELVLKIPIYSLMLVMAIIISRYWLDQIALDPDFADMLPVMKVMNERLLNGQLHQVYDPIPEIWNGVRPIYMPAMWMPYITAVAFHFDMRWISVFAILMGFVFILACIRFRNNSFYGVIQVLVIASLFWWIYADNDIHGVITMSEEGVVIFYFVLLTFAVVSENPMITGIAFSLCLLSRYSMIGWLLPFIIYMLIRKPFRHTIIFLCTVLGCVFLFFILPFGVNTFRQMLALPGNYVAFAKHVWEFTPEVYWLNLGMGKFFGPQNMAALHYTLIVSSFIVPLLFMCFCLFQKKWKLQNINLACFKLSILIFYQFIDVPYGYLFYTSSFVSMALAACLLNNYSRENLMNAG